MSNRFHGKQFRGASKLDRIAKRKEADARNAVTPPERRKTARKGKIVVRVSGD
jgi:hypothetical protein